MEAWSGANRVVIIDAARSGAAPGTIHQLDAHAQRMPERFFHYSTHAFSLAEAIDLARALGQLPSDLIVYSIEGKTFEPGVGLSPGVEKSVSRTALLLMRELEG
ncbi:MAG TPA: hydrogenase maturation protease [Blastocatellia bacterium]|nr:hydrogenase maturation protease [Blastocatellia bacterium]